MFILMVLLFCGQVLGVVSVQQRKMNTKVELFIKFSGSLANFHTDVLNSGFWYENTRFDYDNQDSLDNSQDVLEAIVRKYETLKTDIIFAINKARTESAEGKHGRDYAWTKQYQNTEIPELKFVLNDYAHNYAILILANVLQDLGKSTNLAEMTRTKLYDAMLQKIGELRMAYEKPRQTVNQSLPPQPVDSLYNKYTRLAAIIKTEYETMLRNTPPIHHITLK